MRARGTLAFTLVEAVVVMAVLSILATVGFVTYSRTQEANQTQVGPNVLQTAQVKLRSLAAANPGQQYPKVEQLKASKPSGQAGSVSAQSNSGASSQTVVDVGGVKVDWEAPSTDPGSAAAASDFVVALTRADGDTVPEDIPNMVGLAVAATGSACFSMVDSTDPVTGQRATEGPFRVNYSESRPCKVPVQCLVALNTPGFEATAAREGGFLNAADCVPPAPTPTPGPTTPTQEPTASPTPEATASPTPNPDPTPIATPAPTVTPEPVVPAPGGDSGQLEYVTTFDGNGHTAGDPPKEAPSTAYTRTITLPGPGTLVKNGEMFLGWSEQKNGTVMPATTALSGNVTLYAQWAPRFRVTYDDGGRPISGGVPSPSPWADPRTTLTIDALPDVVAVDTTWKFAGWKNTVTQGVHPGGASFSTTVDVTLVAVWKSLAERGDLGGMATAYTSYDDYFNLGATYPGSTWFQGMREKARDALVVWQLPSTIDLADVDMFVRPRPDFIYVQDGRYYVNRGNDPSVRAPAYVSGTPSLWTGRGLRNDRSAYYQFLSMDAWSLSAGTNVQAFNAYLCEKGANPYNETELSQKCAVSNFTAGAGPSPQTVDRMEIVDRQPDEVTVRLHRAAGFGGISFYVVLCETTAGECEARTGGNNWMKAFPYSETQSSFDVTFTGLKDSTTYAITPMASFNSTQVYGEAFKGRTTLVTSKSVSFTTQLVPDAPTGVRYNTSTRSSVDLYWDRMTSTKTYEIQVAGNAATRVSVPQTAIGATPTYTFTGLTPGSAPTLQIRAVNAKGASAWTDIQVATRPTDPAGVKVPDATVTENTATIDWAASGEPSVVARVRITASGYDRTISEATQSFVTVNGLTANTNYTVTVTACNTVNANVCSNPVATYFTTKLAKPAAPASVWVNNVKQTSATVNWGAVTGAQYYEWRITGQSVWQSTVSTSAPADFLNTANSYTAEVRACSTGGCSTITSSGFGTLPGPVSSVSASGITETAASLSWSVAPGTNVRYTVTVNGAAYTNLATTRNLTGLSGSTAYSVTVQACNADYASACNPTTASTSFTTLSPVPAMPAFTLSASSTPSITATLGSMPANATSIELKSSINTTVNTYTAGGGVRTWNGAGVTNGSSYTVFARACGSGGCSAWRDKTITVPQPTYSCPSGYTPQTGVTASTTCSYSYAATASTTTTYSCPNGGTLSGTTCTKTTTTTTKTRAGTVAWTSSCPPPTYSDGTKTSTGRRQCWEDVKSTTTSTYAATPTTTTTYTCPSGGTRSGTTCTISVASTRNDQTTTV